jgi:hypothetical protein
MCKHIRFGARVAAFMAAVALAWTAASTTTRAEAVPEQWKVTALLHKTTATCDGGRGSIRVAGNTLSFYGQGMLYPAFEVELDADGGAEKLVGAYIHSNRQIRVKVAPGSGPREVTALYERNLCGFVFVPD